mgnify:CR=1 FL=1
MNKALIHQNRKEDWETPPEIFQPLHQFFNFTIDLAATKENSKCPSWVGPKGFYEDFLTLSIDSVRGHNCWINPPYGRFLQPFTRHIATLAKANLFIVALLPGSIDTGWFWDFVQPYARVFGRRGRIQFLPKGASGNPGPSILAVYNRDGMTPAGWDRL